MTKINENTYIGETGYKLKDIVTKEFCVATISSSQSAGSGYVVNLDSISRKEGNFTLNNGKIKVGSGIHHIRASGSIFLDNWPGGNNYSWGVITHNGLFFATSINSGTSSYLSTSIPTTIIAVNEGDEFALISDTYPIAADIRAGVSNTWLCIEKID